MLAAMAAIVVAIAIPSYTAMQQRSQDSNARALVTQGADAAEAYRSDHGSYAGMNPAALRRYDPSLDASSYRLVGLGPKGYCIQANSGGRTWHVGNPAGQLARGSCP